MAIYINILDTGPRVFSEEEARNTAWQKINGTANNVFANNGTTSLDTTGKNYPIKVEGPSEIEAGAEATYMVTEFKENNKDKLPNDKKQIKWAFYIDGVEILDNVNKYIRVYDTSTEKQESTTDYLDDINVKNRTKNSKENAILYAKIESYEPDENKDYKTQITVKFSKWLDGHDVVIEAFRNSPDINKDKAHAVVTKVKAKPEVIGMQWVNKDKLPITFSDYTQEKQIKIHTLGLKDKEIDISIQDGTENQHISFTTTQQHKTIKIKDRFTYKKIAVLHKTESHEAPAGEIIYQIQNPKTLSNDQERPELQLEAHVKKEGENIINTADNLVFAKHLAIYPKEKIVNTYFALLKKKTIDGKEQNIYEKTNQLSIGQKTYLIADCANLGDKTVKLKIHEKAEANGTLKIQTSEDDYFNVCKPKKEGETSYTELPKNNWIEGKVDKDSNQAIIELQMRPKTDKVAKEGEEPALSLEGWNEALLTRKDEETNYVEPKKKKWKKEDIVKHLETNLFLEAFCEITEETENLKLIDKEKSTKLEVGCACNRDFTEDEVKNLINKESLFGHKDCPLPTKDKTYKEFTKQLNNSLNKYEINTCLRKAHFIAQIEAESDHFNTTIEYADGKDYDHKTHESDHTNYELYLKDKKEYAEYKDLKRGYNRYKECIKNGHDIEGYGPKYKGKGLIQITWKSNYKKYFDYIRKSSWISEPEKLANELEYAFDSAGWYWLKGSAWGDINNKADNDDFIAVVVAVNGGLNGFEHRKTNLKRILKEMRVKDKCSSFEKKSIGTYKYETSAIKKSKYGKRNKKTIQSYDD